MVYKQGDKKMILQDNNKTENKMKIRIVTELRDWTISIVTAIVVALLINVFVVELYTVQQSSMWPTFQEGDQILAWKVSRMLKITPDYGDIIIVDGNNSRSRKIKDEFIDSALISKITKRKNENIWIKRVIGKSGDHLEFIDNKVYRNGIMLEEDYLVEEMVVPFESVVVPQNHIYVMGDNRNGSKDSRQVGSIPYENIRGNVKFRFYPFNKASTF